MQVQISIARIPIQETNAFGFYRFIFPQIIFFQQICALSSIFLTNHEFVKLSLTINYLSLILACQLPQNVSFFSLYDKKEEREKCERVLRFRTFCTISEMFHIILDYILDYHIRPINASIIDY